MREIPVISSAEEALNYVRQRDLPYVRVGVFDVDGILRGKYIHKDKFLSAIEGGFGFCNVVFGWDSADACYDNSQYTGWHSGYPDAAARLDRPGLLRESPHTGTRRRGRAALAGRLAE